VAWPNGFFIHHRTSVRKGTLPLSGTSDASALNFAITNLHMDDVAVELSTPLPDAVVQSRAFLSANNKTSQKTLKIAY